MHTENISWRCPSNIAIVKYWGKKENQIPCNPSLSMTLSKSFTEVNLALSEKKSDEEIELEYFFEHRKNEAFESRIKKYLSAQKHHFSFLNKAAIRIDSSNSFPHSAGIASSASAFGAIALALFDAEKSADKHSPEFLQNVSSLARLGSGSACRSMFGAYAEWGKHPNIPNSSDFFAIPIHDVHENFQQMHDAILIVDETTKKVSSSEGHSLMNGHPFAENRFIQANERTLRLVKILQTGDFEEFIHIAESEALTLHAMMMTSANYYILMKPATLSIIEKVISFRNNKQIPVCFTLDAGPNVHLLYPETSRESVEDFIKNELIADYKNVIWDKIGTGPEKVN